MNQWKALLFTAIFTFLILKSIFADGNADGNRTDKPTVETIQHVR